MGVLSKQMFDKAAQGHCCGDIFHNWQPHSCTEGLFIYAKGCTSGIFTFFSIMYGVHYIVLRKKLTMKEIQDIVKDFIRSMMFGYVFATVPIWFNCLQTRILGRLNYYLTSFGTGAAMGLSTILSPKSRFSIEAIYFCILAYINIIKFLSFKRILPRNKMAGLPYFMLTNSVMMALLWMKQNTNNMFKISWIFSPYSPKDESKHGLCSHKGVCYDSFMNETRKFLMVGVSTLLLKVIPKLWNSKDKNPMNILSATYLKDPIFWVTYVALHKAIHCGLTQLKGKDSYNHALIGGFISGLSYLISPNLSLPASQTVLIVMMIFNELKKRFKLPKLSYQYICFVISTSILIYFPLVNKKIASNFIVSMFHLGTNGRSSIVFGAMEKLAKIN